MNAIADPRTDIGNQLPPRWPPVPPLPPRPSPPSRHQAGLVAALAAFALLAGAAGGVVGRATDSAPAPANASAPAASPTVPAVSGRSSQLAGDGLSVKAVVAKIEPSVVSVNVTYRSGRNSGSGAGTGIIISAEGLVVTNAHVVENATTVQVVLAGETEARAATVVGTDTLADIALLQIAGASGLTPAELGASSSVQVGDDVVAVGNALALAGGPTVTRGIVSALDRSIDVSSGTMSGLIQTDAAISSGNSGGPLVNAAGQVIGIDAVVATSDQATSASNIGFAIAIDTVKPVIERLKSGRTSI